MKEPELLGVGEDRLLLLHALRFAMLLVDILKTRDGGVVLDKTNARGERDDDGDVEEKVALPALLAGREWAGQSRAISPESQHEQDKNGPIEHAKELHKALLAPRGSDGWDLDREAVHAAVVAEDGESAEVGAMGARDVKLVRKVADANVVRVVVLVLDYWKEGSACVAKGLKKEAHLEVLSRDLDLVKLLVLKLDEPVADALEIRLLGALVEERLVAIAPSLEALDVVAKGRLGREEVPFELSLWSVRVVQWHDGIRGQEERVP